MTATKKIVVETRRITAHKGNSLGEARKGTRRPATDAYDPANADNFCTSSLRAFHQIDSRVTGPLRLELNAGA
jgi:hypothetical protein